MPPEIPDAEPRTSIVTVSPFDRLIRQTSTSSPVWIPALMVPLLELIVCAPESVSLSRMTAGSAGPRMSAASIGPVATSRSQSPPNDGDPVRSSEAATSPPVAAAIASIRPEPLPATLQPHSRTSPSTANASPMAANSAE